MGYGRLATVECGALHQSFLLPECEASGAQGSDRIRSVAFHRPGRRNNLQLRTRIFRLLLQEKRLPMHSMPHKGGDPSPKEENDSAQTELSWRLSVRPQWDLGGQNLFGGGPASFLPKHLVMGRPVKRGPAGSGSRASGNRFQMPAQKVQRRISARVFAVTVIHARLAFVYRPARL